VGFVNSRRAGVQKVPHIRNELQAGRDFARFVSRLSGRPGRGCLKGRLRQIVHPRSGLGGRPGPRGSRPGACTHGVRNHPRLHPVHAGGPEPTAIPSQHPAQTPSMQAVKGAPDRTAPRGVSDQASNRGEAVEVGYASTGGRIRRKYVATISSTSVNPNRITAAAPERREKKLLSKPSAAEAPVAWSRSPTTAAEPMPA
jgi:hypothetical protein